VVATLGPVMELEVRGGIKSIVRQVFTINCGVFGAACARHEVPLVNINMYLGERYAYADQLIQHLSRKHMHRGFFDYNPDSQMVLYYDINCKYKVNFWTRNDGLVDLHADNVKFIIPEFHIYAHQGDCPDKYHPKRNPACGNTDGEACERWWSAIGTTISNLGKFDMITRDMLARNRIAQLEDVNLYIRQRKLGDMYDSLRKVLSKAYRDLSDYRVIYDATELSEADGLQLKCAFEANEFEGLIRDQNSVGRQVVAVQLPSALGKWS
jgi:hypothetical protein